MRSITHRQLAKLLPKPSGALGVHHVTVLRRVARGELPPFDFEFSDGTRGWNGETVAADPRLYSFVADEEAA